MLDKNGKEIKTGDVVMISGAYFKNDNGLYFVNHSPNDPLWTGRDYCLHKLNKNGTPSKSKYSTAFWPLFITVNSYEERAKARDWNKKHAEIEILNFNKIEGVKEYFSAELDKAKEDIEYYSLRFPEDKKTIAGKQGRITLFETVLSRLEQQQEQDPPPKRQEQEQEQEQTTKNIIETDPEQTEPEQNPAEEAQEKPKEQEPTKTLYYPINEEIARTAWQMVHFSDYRTGSTTAEYRSAVDSAAELVKQQKQKVSPFYFEKLDSLLDAYSRRLATWYNDYNRNGASCPSVMISGASNFPVKKKEKQNQREGTLWTEYDKIKELLEKIRSIGTGPVDLADPHAEEILKEQLEQAQKLLEDAKAANAYYRKHKTLSGCPGITDEEKEWLNRPGVYHIPGTAGTPLDLCGKPFPDYELTSRREKVKRLEQRLSQLEQINVAKAAPAADLEFDGGRIVENAEINRLQIVFDYIPPADLREKLKKEAFHWSSKNKAWQRQLTENAKAAARRALDLDA